MAGGLVCGSCQNILTSLTRLILGVIAFWQYVIYYVRYISTARRTGK